jgi:hypothetical protein
MRSSRSLAASRPPPISRSKSTSSRKVSSPPGKTRKCPSRHQPPHCAPAGSYDLNSSAATVGLGPVRAKCRRRITSLR